MTDPAVLTLPARGGATLRVVFARAGDRFTHRVEVGQDGGWQVVAEALEGALDDAWPPSPPLQQLHTEARAADQTVALLVGMAGRGHWSLVVEPTADGTAFLFDAACRVSVVPAWLGSSYRVFDATRNADGVVLGRGEFGSVVLADAADAAVGKLAISSDEPGRVRCQLAEMNARLPTTFRWRYRIGISGQVGR